MARGLNILDVHLFQLFDIIEDSLKLRGERIELLFIKMKFCQIGNSQHVCTSDGHS